MTFKIACSSRPSGSDFEAAIEFALSHGFDGIDYNLDFARLPVASGAVARLRSMMAGANLPFKFHAPCTDVELGHVDPEVRQTSLRYLGCYVNAVAALGGTEITIHLGSKSIGSPETDLKGAIDAVAKLVRHGATKGVTVCLENLKAGWTADPETYNALLTATGAAATFDIGHANASECVRRGMITAAELVRTTKAPILSAHVYEVETPSGVHLHPQNLDNIGEVVEALVERGCEWFVVELPCYDSVPYVQQLLAEFRDGWT